MARKQHYATVGIIFGETFKLYFNNFLNLVIPCLFIYLPLYLVSMGVLGRNSEIFETANTAQFWIWYTATILIMSLAGNILSYYLTRFSCNAYLEREEEPKIILKTAFQRFFSLLFLSILLTLGFLGGYLLLIAPGFIFYLGWSLYLVVFAEEELKGRKALKRSWQLTKGFKGEIFGVAFILIMALYVIVIIVTLVVVFAFRGVFSALFDNSTEAITNQILMGMGGAMGIFTAILAPFYYLVPTVFYFNLKKEKEGFVTENLSASFMASLEEKREFES